MGRAHTYASEAMLARRSRILRETCKIIAERGSGCFTLAEVSARSDVALRTIYNSFASRDLLIAAAIDDHAGRCLADVPDRSRRNPISDNVDRLRGLVRHFTLRRAELIAFSDLHSSAGFDSPVRTVLEKRSFECNWVIAGDLALQGRLMTGVVARKLAQTLVQAEMAGLDAWARRDIADRDAEPLLIGAFTATLAQSLVPSRPGDGDDLAETSPRSTLDHRGTVPQVRAVAERRPSMVPAA